jgi:hypothetical protein
MQGEWKNSFETISKSSRQRFGRPKTSAETGQAERLKWCPDNRKDTRKFVQPRPCMTNLSLGFAISSAAPEQSVRHQNHPGAALNRLDLQGDFNEVH